jgi:type IV secretory pathway VirJ component
MALLCWTVLACAFLACGRQVPPPEHLDGGRLGEVVLRRPAGAPQALVFLFSDEGGSSPAWDRSAERIRAGGAAVIAVDLAAYLDGLRRSDDGCHYLISEIEALSQRVQRELGSASYGSPVLAGAGAGGTLAYAALAQAPAATIAGAVSVDPSPVLATRVALCPGAPARPAAGGFAYGAPSALPGFFRVSSRAALDAPVAALAEGGVQPAGDGSPEERLADRVVAALAVRSGAMLRGLPLVELPSPVAGSTLAVIYSGDGGWRDLDKAIGEILAREGVPVVGVDSLRYFWRRKTPEQVADDLAAIQAHYCAAWGRTRTALVGYSFGAGILPFAVNRLPEPERARVVQVSLLGLGTHAAFEFKASGWLPQLGLDVDPYRDEPLVLPELQRIDPRLVQCVYGDEETDTACTSPALARIEAIRTRGSHHFDGDYPALAARILAGLRRREAGLP